MLGQIRVALFHRLEAVHLLAMLRAFLFGQQRRAAAASGTHAATVTHAAPVSRATPFAHCRAIRAGHA